MNILDMVIPDMISIGPNKGAFYRSKIGSITLKLLHFFGLKMNVWLEEDVTIRLSTNYNSENSPFDESPDWIIQDVMSLTRKKLESDHKLRFRCGITGFILVRWYENTWGSSRVFPYSDGVLFESIESFKRDRKIDRLLC